MTKYSNNNPPTSNCFTGILQMFICGGNLPAHHPSPHDRTLEKPEKSRSFSHNVDNGSVLEAQAHVQAQDNSSSGPGIIARLMGLDSLPNNNSNNYENDDNKITTLDSLFRSKSLNSLHFLPDFDPTRAAFHRRARTSASFHEQGRINYNFVPVRDDCGGVDGGIMRKEMKAVSESNNDIIMRRKNRHDNDGTRITKRSNKSKKRYEEERYYSSREFRNNNNNVRNSKLKEELVKKKGRLNGKVVTSKKKVYYHKENMLSIEVQSDDQLPSRSPVSVLDDYYYKEFEFLTLSKGERRQTTSNSSRKTSPKFKTNDNLQQEIMPKSRENHEEYCNMIAIKQEQVKEEVDAADYLVEMLGKICKLAEEEHKRDSKWVTKYELWKVHFVEEVCIDLGQELLDLLLDQLLDELVMSL